MDRQKFEQRCAIKFCVKCDESSTVTYEKLQRAYGEHSLSRAQVFRCHKSLLEGREQVEDELRAGRPSTSKKDNNVKRLRSLVRSDRRLTLRIISIKYEPVYRPSNFNTGFGHEKRLRQDGSKEPHD